MSTLQSLDDPQRVRTLNILGAVPPRDVGERLQGQVDGLLSKLEPLVPEFKSKRDEIHQTFVPGKIAGEIGKLQTQYKSKGATAIQFAKNMIDGEFKAAQDAMPPERPKSPAKDDVRAALELREIRDTLRRMEVMARPLFFRAAAKAGCSSIITAVLDDPCVVPGFNEIMPQKQINAVLQELRRANYPEAFERLEGAERASKFVTTVTTSFNRLIDRSGMDVGR